MKTFKKPSNAAKYYSKIFKQMNWTWGNNDGTHYVPDEKELLKTYRDLAGQMKKNTLMSSTGRLCVLKTDDTQEKIYTIHEDSDNEYMEKFGE